MNLCSIFILVEIIHLNTKVLDKSISTTKSNQIKKHFKIIQNNQFKSQIWTNLNLNIKKKN